VTPITFAGSACHPLEPERLWVAIEAGALESTIDGGRTWRDRVAAGPWDTHELAVHRDAPGTLRVAAGDGYFESDDAGATWRSPSAGLEVGYLRSVTMDPGQTDVVVVSAASGPYSAYVARRSDGCIAASLASPGSASANDWPERPSTIAPLLCAGAIPGELWAADERGVHRSDDSGRSWRRAAGYATSPQHLRGLALVR
jgi:ligand-binding sensor domain-containing protein